jgi:hypothetical protein
VGAVLGRRMVAYGERETMLIAELEDFVQSHRGHGELTADPGPARQNGYRLSVGCRCGAIFERWITPADAGVELALLARWNAPPSFAGSARR